MINTDKRGSVLVLIYVLIVVLLTLGAALLRTSFSEKNMTGKSLYTSRAFWLAEAGIQRGLWELRHNGTSFAAPNPNQWSETLYSNSTPPVAIGYYTVAYDHVAHTINATGYYPNMAAADKVAKSVSITVENPGIPYFKYAAFGKKSIYFNNNALTDSYNSSVGNYSISHCNGADCQGDVGTNGNGTNPSYAITVNNNADILGNVSSGGANDTMTITNQAHVSGELIYNKTVDLPSYSVPASLTTLAYASGTNISGGSLTLDNNNVLNLSGGDIKLNNVLLDNNAVLNITGDAKVYLTGNIAIQNNAQLVIAPDANVTFYVDGRYDFNNNGGVNNLGQRPMNFTFFSNYTGNISMANNVAFYGAIFSPNTNLTVENNAGTFGAVVGYRVQLENNGGIHYDTELSKLTNDTLANVNQTTWREI